MFTREPDPASTWTSTTDSSRPDCTAALAGVNSAAADGSVLAGTSDRASAYFTTGGRDPSLSHSVARFPTEADAATAFAALARLPARCPRWREQDGHGTTVVTTVTPYPVTQFGPDETAVAFTIRIVASGDLRADVLVRVAATQRGRSVALLASTDASGQARGAGDPLRVLAEVSQRLPR